MSPFVAEFIGTTLLIVFGNGVVANVVLARTKGNNAGWIVIAAGWGLAVFIGAFCSAPFSGPHLNPAVTVAMATAGTLSTGTVPRPPPGPLARGPAGLRDTSRGRPRPAPRARLPPDPRQARQRLELRVGAGRRPHRWRAAPRARAVGLALMQPRALETARLSLLPAGEG